MPIKEVTFSKIRKVNLGNYENTDIHASVTIEITERKKSVEELAALYYERLDNIIDAEVQKL